MPGQRVARGTVGPAAVETIVARASAEWLAHERVLLGEVDLQRARRRCGRGRAARVAEGPARGEHVAVEEALAHEAERAHVARLFLAEHELRGLRVAQQCRL